MLDKSTTQRLRSLPVEAVAERLGLRVVRHKSLCPFHDDHHASLSYSPSRNTFRCFVCDARGGTIDLVMRHLNMSFPDACRWLANGTNIILDTYRPRTPTVDRPARPFDAARYARLFEHPWLSDEARTFLFTERRLDPRVVSWCRLTSWTDRQGTHWLQTPFFDASGQLIGLQNRNLDYGKQKGDEGEEDKRSVDKDKQEQGSEAKQGRAIDAKQGQGSETKQGRAGDGKQGQAGDGKQGQAIEGKHGQGSEAKQGQVSECREAPRFRFPYGSRCTVYNLPVTAMLRPGEPLFITEGCSDCWAMLSAGHKAIAIPSATLLSQADKALLRDLAQRLGTSFHMFPDRDAPGERLFMQLREVLPGLQHHQLAVGCKDFAEYYVSALAKNKLGEYG
ncbi:MAG: CHC2 zinc finger domain-containing protein [Prevotella sp.]|nr:CHC2 zinc finger domain-containing protein [Prevotella sp.]